MLALAARQQARGATAVQRQRLLEGTARFVRELQADDAAAAQNTSTRPVTALCLGLRTALDAVSAEMLAHAFTSNGHPARALPLEGWGKAMTQDLGSATVQRIYLCTLSATPQTQARVMCRRLRRHWPSAEIVLVAWCGSASLGAEEDISAMGVDAVALRLDVLVESAAPQPISQPAAGGQGADATLPHA
jgi:methylmalonyl-CoA mutase cobalamin-binding subunit